MYVCVCMCMFVCMYVCVCLCKCVFMYVCVYCPSVCTFTLLTRSIVTAIKKKLNLFSHGHHFVLLFSKDDDSDVSLACSHNEGHEAGH